MYEGTVTRPPAKMLRAWEIQIRLDSGILMEFQVVRPNCDIRANERIRVSFYPSVQEGDLLVAEEIYSITRRKKVLSKSFFKKW